MRKRILITALLALLVLGSAGGAYAASADGAPRAAAFIETLIQKGVIPSSQVGRARSFVLFLLGVNRAPDDGEGVNVDKIVLEASQYIAHANLTFKEGEPIEGIILRIRNTTESTIELEGRRGCHVSYKIFTADRSQMLYDSATADACKTGERAHYFLPPLGHRTFPIIHSAETYRLAPGDYIFELNYPEYGSAERTVTVTK